tara:strand:+ start:1917 stop:2471 length:555 start_codon:yes stop_codon:yes gene_type:complete
MLDKLEIELKKIAKKILSSSNSINLDEISKDILDLYEKIILYKYSKKNQSSVLTPDEIIKDEEFKSSKKPPEEIIKLKPIEEQIHNNIIQEGNDYKRDQETKKNLNDQFARELQIDLNDKNAFIKHLFDGNKIVYQQTIKEIESLNQFQQVKKVIEKTKKYHNNWKKKESYEKRFIYLIHKNFL